MNLFLFVLYLCLFLLIKMSQLVRVFIMITVRNITARLILAPKHFKWRYLFLVVWIIIASKNQRQPISRWIADCSLLVDVLLVNILQGQSALDAHWGILATVVQKACAHLFHINIFKKLSKIIKRGSKKNNNKGPLKGEIGASIS